MARRFLSILSLTLIFAVGAGPMVAVAQTETFVPETEVPELPSADATSTEPLLPTTIPEPAIEVEEVAPVVVPVETIDPATYVAGEVIVKYKESHVDLTVASDTREVASIVESIDMTTSDTIPSLNIAVISTEGTSVESAIAELESNPEVEYAEPNYIRTIDTLSSTSPELASLWALQNTGQDVNGSPGTEGADVDALSAWNIASGTAVTVAVIDTGVEYTHPDLADNMWDGSNCVSDTGTTSWSCTHGYNFEYDTSDPLATSTDSTGSHGTHVAGIIAAAHNDSGVVGIAYGASIMALRFGLDTLSEIRAINFAIENDVKIINASYGGETYADSEYQAILAFQESGGLFVASAGNSEQDTDIVPIYPASYDLPAIVSVGSSEADDTPSSFSNFGQSSVDVFAPGRSITSTIPLGGYEEKSGTSMSAPLVAGTAALLWSYDPMLTAAEVKAALMDGGDALTVLDTLSVSGRRLNAYGSLALVASTSTPTDTTAPVIALLGDNPMNLTVGDTFTDPGAEVTDDTDATTTITGTGAVDTATAGTYTRSYTASDTAGNAAATTTRSVVVSAPVVSSGGGGGGGSSSRGGGGGSSTVVTKKVIPEVPVSRELFTAPTAPRVLGATTYTFSVNLAVGATGTEVMELQKALTASGFYTGPVSGYFGPLTQSAVKAFQSARGLVAVGNVGPQTRAALNASTGVTPQANSTAAIISALQAQLQLLLAQLALLQAKGT